MQPPHNAPRDKSLISWLKLSIFFQDPDDGEAQVRAVQAVGDQYLAHFDRARTAPSGATHSNLYQAVMATRLGYHLAQGDYPREMSAEEVRSSYFELCRKLEGLFVPSPILGKHVPVMQRITQSIVTGVVLGLVSYGVALSFAISHHASALMYVAITLIASIGTFIFTWLLLTVSVMAFLFEWNLAAVRVFEDIDLIDAVYANPERAASAIAAKRFEAHVP